MPFGTEDTAEAFAEEHGGEVVAFEAVPEDYVLGATSEPLEMQPTRGMAGDHEMQSMASPED